MSRPLYEASSHLEVKHEDEDLKTSAVKEDYSKHISKESGLPNELHSTRKWISLFRGTSASDAISEADDMKPSVSEANWEKENSICSNLSRVDSTTSGGTPCWEEETRTSAVTSCCQEERGPLGTKSCWVDGTSNSGATHCWEEEPESPGVTPCWHGGYEITKTQPDKETKEDGRDSCKHEQTPEEDTEDTLFPSAMGNSHLEDEHSLTEPSTSEKHDVSIDSSDIRSVVYQLRDKLEEVLVAAKDQLQKTSKLEESLDDPGILLRELRHRVDLLESRLLYPSTDGFEMRNDSCSSKLLAMSLNEPLLGVDELIFVMGGYDGLTWLPTMDCYSPSRDIVKSYKPMSSVRSNASAAVLNGLIYNFGGWNCYAGLWYDTVECYNPLSNEWISCAPLSQKKGCLAGASINNKIFAVGGGNGIDCFREVEMFDPLIGRWIPTQSMLQKRFASAAAELDGVLYVVGGYDGKKYLKSAERFDPREVSWSKLQSMSTSRGSHALTVFKGKLYALGGYDGNRYVPSIEIFDPCMGTWIAGDDMKQSRGHFVAPVIGESIHAIGGQTEGNDIVKMVETYRLGHGWSATKLKGIGKRCLFSAVLYPRVVE